VSLFDNIPAPDMTLLPTPGPNGAVKPGEGRVLFVVHHGIGQVLCHQLDPSVSEWISDTLGHTNEAFHMECFGGVPIEEGVYVGELKMVDDGPADGSLGGREAVVDLVAHRLATEDEWKSHVGEEYPWDPNKEWSV